MALIKPFAQNGNKTAIPQTTSDGSVSYDQGFGAFYALAPEEGGLFIDRAQFNQLMYDTTSQVLDNKNAIATKANANAVVNLSGNQSIAGVKTFNTPPISATNPTNNNQVANKAYVDSVGNSKVATTTYNRDKATFATKTELNTKANANATVNLTGNQTIAGVKTFSSPVVVPNATANTHAVNLSQLNTKANANATVNLTGNQSIAGAKTFTSNITAPNITAMQNNLNSIFSSTSTPVTYLTTNKIITVGSSGADFTDLLSAVKKAATYTSPVEVKLISNLTNSSNILISNLNGRHITINFNNFKISSSAVSSSLVFERSLINELIDISLEKNQIFFSNSIAALSGNIIINNPNRFCLSAGNNSIVCLRGNTTITLTTKDNGSCFYLYSGSIVSAINSTINDNSNYTTGGKTFEVLGGTLVSLTGSTINSPQSRPLANMTTNTLTANGIIFK